MKKNKKTERLSVVEKLLLATAFFNIWFPKAGIKLSEIPITVGSVLFGMTIIIWLLVCIHKKSIKIDKTAILIAIMGIYFIFKYLLTNNLTGNSLTYIVSLSVYPVIYIVCKQYSHSNRFNELLRKIVVYGFFFITIYALLQFIFGISNVSIPGLTVNYSDYIEHGAKWYMTKSNGTTESAVKIVSTYQNGNLFGVNLLLIFPFAFLLLGKTNKNKMMYISLMLFIICVALSLSRTCWVVGSIEIMLLLLFSNAKNGRIDMRKILAVLLIPVAVLAVIIFMPSTVERFTGTKTGDWLKMSGRSEGLTDVMKSINESGRIDAILFGPEGVIEWTGLAYEMVPLALFTQGGIVGCLLFYLACVYAVRGKQSKEKKIATESWMLASLIEGGYWLPPTAMNLYMLAAINEGEEK